MDDEDARARVVRWAADRYGVTLAARKQKQDNVGGGGEAGDVTPDEFAELSDLIAAAAPTNDEDRALVVGYWLQELQKNQVSDFPSQSVNTELKHLGHGVENITRVLENLKSTSPKQVIQTRKKGTSRQGRKRFKLTKVGKDRVKALIAGTAADRDDE